MLDTVELPVRANDETDISELSGLGWDADEQLLYAVSDNGYLYHFKIEILDRKIKHVDPVYASELADSSRGLLSSNLTNAEGLHIHNGNNSKKGDAELLVAFEDGPAIARYTPQTTFIKEIDLPQPIDDPSIYSSSNKRLESVTEMQDLGVLTAPEAHLAHEPEDIHSIFAMDGRKWSFAALQLKQDSVKALDPLPGGRLLVLERTRDDTDATQSHLRIVDMAHCEPDTKCPTIELPVSDPVAFAKDFEGMTSILNDQFLLVTDSPKGGTMLLFRLVD